MPIFQPPRPLKGSLVVAHVGGDFAGGSRTRPPGSQRKLSGLLLMALLALTQPRHARAEDSVSVKYQDYREAGGRIAVQVRSALFEQDLGPMMHLKVMGIMDSIAGATPDGEPAPVPGGQVPLSFMDEERKAWTLDFSRQLGATNVAVGVANSRESDYVSHGWSLNTLTDFHLKNTSLAIGVAGTDDDIKVYFQVPRTKKRTLDVLVGLNQLLDPLTTVSFNLTHSQANGYLSDPYKLVQRNTEVFPGIFLLRTYNENRPDHRSTWIALASINRAIPQLNGAFEASYRFHTDDFGMYSHTLSVAWFQKLGTRFVLRPSVRFFSQSAADFYVTTLTGSSFVPLSRPSGHAPFYSADYRLSKLDTWDYGLKAIWIATDHWQLDAAIEGYDMRGRDGITAASAYPRATTATFGLKLTF